MNPIPQPEHNEASALAAAKVAARTAAEGVEMPPIVEQYYEFCAWLLPKVSKFEKDISEGSFGRIELALQNGNEHQLTP